MNNTEIELRNLMKSYRDRYIQLLKEEKECLNVNEELTVEALQRQCRVMMAELFATLKSLNILDEEEKKWGAIKE